MKEIFRNGKKFVITNALYECIKKKKSFLKEVEEDNKNNPITADITDDELTNSPATKNNDFLPLEDDGKALKEKLFRNMLKNIKLYMSILLNNIKKAKTDENFYNNKEYALLNKKGDVTKYPIEIIDEIHHNIMEILDSLNEKNREEVEKEIEKGTSPVDFAEEIVKLAISYTEGLSLTPTHDAAFMANNAQSQKSTYNKIVLYYYLIVKSKISFLKEDNIISLSGQEKELITIIKNMLPTVYNAVNKKIENETDAEIIKEMIKNNVENRIRMDIKKIKELAKNNDSNAFYTYVYDFYKSTIDYVNERIIDFNNSNDKRVI